MKKEYWCCCLVIMINDTEEKELRGLMRKISEMINGRHWELLEWDYSVKESLKRGENFVDIHNCKTEIIEKKLNNILKKSNLTYRWTDEYLGTCESCFQ